MGSAILPPGTGAGGALDIESDNEPRREYVEPNLGDKGEDVDAEDGEARTGDASGVDESVSTEVEVIDIVVMPDPEGMMYGILMM